MISSTQKSISVFPVKSPAKLAWILTINVHPALMIPIYTVKFVSLIVRLVTFSKRDKISVPNVSYHATLVLASRIVYPVMQLLLINIFQVVCKLAQMRRQYRLLISVLLVHSDV